MNIPEEVLFDISMKVYDEYNDKIATMYDYVGEIYTYQDIEEMKQAEEEYERELIQQYLDGKLKYTEEDIQRIREYLNN